MAQAPKIIFFLAGAVATQAEVDAINALGQGVQLRNAALIDPDAPMEECDGADGAVPPPYTDMTPLASDTEAVERRRAIRMGEVPADELTDDEKARMNDPRLTRGAQPPTVNERLAEFRPLPDAPKPAEGWDTEPPANPSAPPPTTPPA